VLHTRGTVVTDDDLPARIRVARPDTPLAAAGVESRLFADMPSLDEMERRYLLYVLEAVNGNRTRAAEVLKIDRRTLYRMAERFGVKLEP
jgi:DNA-binding NtrC family response regulator